MLSAALAWWRMTAYLVEEAFGQNHAVMKSFPIFRTPIEWRQPRRMPGFGEPGVKRGVPKPVALNYGPDGLTEPLVEPLGEPKVETNGASAA